MNVIQKLFGTHSDRELKRIMPLVEKIESLRPTMAGILQMKSCGARPKSTRSAWQKGRLWMICFRRHLPLSVRQPSEY